MDGAKGGKRGKAGGKGRKDDKCGNGKGKYAQYQWVRGTVFHTLKDGITSRVVIAPGQEFAPEDLQGVRVHLSALGRALHT